MPVSLNVTPTTLADAPLAMSITGCAPQAHVPVTLRCGAWHSTATFQADQSGTIDLSASAPLQGDYDGSDPTGLFWSMRDGTLLPSAYAAPNRLQVEVADETFYFERLYAAPGVLREEIRERGLAGVMYRPADSGPHACVLLLNGSGGGVNQAAAALLASHGYAAFSLAFFNYAALQPDLCRIPLEYFAAAIEWLKARPDVDSNRIAVRGASRGGELALLLASRFPDLRAVLALVPSSVVWSSVSDREERLNQPSWMHDGEPVPFNRRVVLPAEANPESVEAVAFTPGFLKAMDDEAAAREAEIEVERINGPVLMISGADDAMWPSSYFSERVLERLSNHQFPHAASHHSFANAGHGVAGLPYQPTTPGPAYHPVRKMMVAFGGTPAGDAHGAAESWRLGLEFLRTHLG